LRAANEVEAVSTQLSAFSFKTFATFAFKETSLKREGRKEDAKSAEGFKLKAES
jgi:hypothetical protein